MFSGVSPISKQFGCWCSDQMKAWANGPDPGATLPIGKVFIGKKYKQSSRLNWYRTLVPYPINKKLQKPQIQQAGRINKHNWWYFRIKRDWIKAKSNNERKKSQNEKWESEQKYFNFHLHIAFRGKLYKK